MQIKSVIIDNIHNINFIMFNITTLFFTWIVLLKLECILSYLPNPSARAGYDTRSIF